MGYTVDLAERIEAFLHGQTLSLPYVVRRAWAPMRSQMTLTSLELLVCPRALVIDMESDQANMLTLTTDIAINRLVEDDYEIDSLVDFVEELSSLFDRLNIDYDSDSYYACDERKIDPVYDAALLRESKQFSSVLTLTWKIVT